MKDLGQVAVRLPALCANPPEELIPLPSNATDVRKTPSRIFFSSPDSAEQGRDYYLAELSSQGWMASQAPSDGFGQVVQASITTPQDIQIVLNIRIHNMGAGGCSVDMDWQAR